MNDRLRAARYAVAVRLRAPFGLRVWHVLVASVVLAVVLLGVIALFASIAFKLNETQNDQIQANARAIENNRRLDRLERPPNDRELALAAARALRACVADDACRRALRGSIRRTNLRPSDVPSLRPRTTATPDSGGSSSGGTSGDGTGGGGTSSSPDTTPSNPRQPSGSRPPAARRPRPPGTAPSRPVPGRTAPTPSSSTPETPPTPSTPVPVPRPPAPVPTVPPPPPPPVTVTTPGVPLPPICTPVVQVNCRRPNGRIVGPTGAAADPADNSGRGNQEEPLCERVKAPCDDAGNPVFPDGLFRLPPS